MTRLNADRRVARVAIIALGALITVTEAAAQPHCPTAEIPAYSHNDYNNPNPLHDAVALGYRGVEADVFLVGGQLRVGHSRKEAERGARLDSLYVLPLRDLINRCNREAAVRRAPREPFLVNIEIKESSVETLAAVHQSVLALRNQLADERSNTTELQVQVTLVGFYLAAESDSTKRYPELGVSCKLEHSSGVQLCLRDPRVRMLSVDYGKTLGRWYTLDVQRARWLRALKTVSLDRPDLIIRVYNVPFDAGVYQQLLHSGVDLIGTKELNRTRELLTRKN